MREFSEVHKAIVRTIDHPLRKNEIMQRLKDAGVEIGEKTLQRRLKEAVEWGKLDSPLKGYYSPVQPKD
jgi:DNA-binding HxlR family transcriptional regulator